MPTFHTPVVPDGTYFFTATLLDPQATLFTDEIALLRATMRLCKKRWPFEISAAVILPAKMHMIWQLPATDPDDVRRWRFIKSTFARHAAATGAMASRGETALWQRRFSKHLIRDQADYDLHMHLITMAPVRAGLVRRPRDWPYASFGRPAPTAPKTIVPVPSNPDQAIAGNAS